MKPDDSTNLAPLASTERQTVVLRSPWSALAHRAQSLGLYVSRHDYGSALVVDIEHADRPPRYARLVVHRTEGVDHESLLYSMVGAAIEELGRQRR